MRQQHRSKFEVHASPQREIRILKILRALRTACAAGKKRKTCRLLCRAPRPCDFAREGSSCCLKNLPCCVPQKESLLWATNATGIKISGGGTIDGNAPYNDWHRGPSNRSADGKHAARAYGDFWHMCRPRMVELRYTRGAVITNLTIKNSIMFNLHAAHVTNLRVSHITIHSLGPNTDGFNVAGTDMEITDSSVCNNDDCIPVNAPTNGEAHGGSPFVFF